MPYLAPDATARPSAASAEAAARSVATSHYRQMFDRRSPQELKTLAHIKRFMERLVSDPGFREGLAAHIDNPSPLLAQHGIEVDAMQMLPLWRGTYLRYRNKPECAQWPLAALWDEYIAEMIRHRDLLRDEGDMSVSNPRFHAWRERQIQRCSGELGGSANSVTHPVIAFELSEGCTVGCWFCGLSADRYKGHFAYTPDNAALWQGVVGVAGDLFGSAARTGFCYWATDPCDNPDYDHFLLDYYNAVGAMPQTTTAAPLKNEALTRRVLALFDKYRTVTNRFSVLTIRHLNQIHAAFTPEELMGVELVMQNKEALSSKADAGRARDRKAKLRAANRSDSIALIQHDHTTIACVSGFLVSMPLGRIQLVTPVPGSERWPLGYRIVAERHFKTVEKFRSHVQDMIAQNMPLSVPANEPVRFRRDLAFDKGDGIFMLRSRAREHQVQDVHVPAFGSVGQAIAAGDLDAGELIARTAAADPVGMMATASLLDDLFTAGLLESDLTDEYANRRNEGLESRVAVTARTLIAEGLADAATA